MNEELKTNLYEVGADRFYIKSNCVKAYPASWRNTEDDVCFNPEAVLNTEYNNTRTAGSMKNMLDIKECSVNILDDENKMYSFKCFIEGYSFEIFGLTLPNTTKNLYLGIRTMAQAVGDTSLDITRVLVPYMDTDLSAPECLDKPFGKEALDEYYVPKTENGEYLFRGLVFATEPIDTQSNNQYLNNYFYTVQILKDGAWNNTLVHPNIKAGEATNYASVLLGDTNDTLKAPNVGMVAAGRYNSANSDTILAVGLGDSDSKRRNAFEISGHTTVNEDIPFETVIQSGPFKVTYNGELESKQLNAAVSGVYTINDGIELAPNGSHIIINKNGNPGSNIGIHSYGHVNVIGSHIYFKDTDMAKENPRTIADFYVDNLVNGTTVVDRGLFMTGIGDINNGAFVFRPGAVENSFTLKSINNESITLNADASDIILKNQNNLQLKNATLSGIKEIKNTDTGFIVNDKLRFKNDTIGFIDSLKFTEILGDGKEVTRCELKRDTNGIGQLLQFEDFPTTSGNLGAHIGGIAGMFRLTSDAASTNAPSEMSGAGIKFGKDKKTTIIGDLDVTGSVTFGTMDVGNTNNTLITSIINALYPIGSIYLTMNAELPAAFTTGMTWAKIAQGRTLVGVDSSNEPFNAGKTGGRYDACIVEHTHGLSALKIDATNPKSHTSLAQWSEQLDVKTENTKKWFLLTENQDKPNKDWPCKHEDGSWKPGTDDAHKLSDSVTECGNGTSINKPARYTNLAKATHSHQQLTQTTRIPHAHPIITSSAGSDGYTGLQLNAGDPGKLVHWGACDGRKGSLNNAHDRKDLFCTDWFVCGSDQDRTTTYIHQSASGWDSGYPKPTTDDNGSGCKYSDEFHNIAAGTNTLHQHRINEDNAEHRHSIPGHQHTFTLDFSNEETDSTGDVVPETNLDNMPPYITCYIWKRVS